MKLKFFEKDGQLNLEAISAGVYLFKLGVLGDSEEQYFPLYIGESYCMLSRCSNHLYEVFHTDPSYFGLTKKNLENEQLQLVVDIYKRIPLHDGISNSDRDINLRAEEMSAIKKLRPLTQNESNDNLKKNRVEIVQEKITALLSKR